MSDKWSSNRGRRGSEGSRRVHFGILPALLLATAAGSGGGAASAPAASTPASSAAAPSAAGAAPAGWLDSAQRDLTQREYELSWQASPVVDDVEASWHAPNRSQDFRTYFTSEGIRVVPRTGSTPSWRWGLSLVGYGLGERTWVAPQATLSASGHRIDYYRGSLDERYENTPEGLEQIFTLPAPPGHGDRDEVEVRGWSTALKRPAGTRPASMPNPHADPGGEELSDSRDCIHLDLALWGGLSPRMSGDGQAIDFVTPTGAPVLRYAQLKVTDARGEILPAWMEGFASEGMQGIRLVVDARDAVYPITVDPLTTSAAWTAESNQANAHFGSSVATAGDVNGDGYSDVIVGANLYDNGQTDEGRAYVYLGSAGGLSPSPAWTAESDQAGANFGNSVATAGDVNGDGYSDVIVGAFNFQNGQGGEGRAFLYLGSASGLATTAAWTAESDQIGAQFGWSVATAGDVNGDGRSDVVVGANLYDSDIGDEGKAYLYLGSASASGLAATPAWTATTEWSFGEFGASVATAGDVNGDGYADVIVGEPGYPLAFQEFGAASLYLGSPSGLAASPFWTVTALAYGGAFGRSVATAGDTNGDGYADILVGDPDYSGALTKRGVVVLYRGSASDPPEQWATFSGGSSNEHLGISVSTAGDVNGDGHADIVIGADDPATPSQERLRIYLGSATGPSTTPVLNVLGTGGFGISVATAGDVNGDGYSDVIAGANLYDNGQTDEGRALLYLGAASLPPSTPSWTGAGDQASSAFGAAVSTAGDINGDGYSDVVVGAPYYDNGQADEGRAFLYLGSASGLPSAPAWTAEGNQAGANFGSVATAGDVNGDGFSDVLVGALFYDNGQSDEGRAYLYLGSASGLGTTAVWTAEGDQTNAYLGWSLAPAGDVNGDGYADVVIGVPGYTSGVGGGPALVYLGSATGLATVPAWTAAGNLATGAFGSSVATAGDVNADGYADVIVGAPFSSNGETEEGSAYLYLGSAAGLSPNPSWTTEGNQFNALYGSSVATAGDVNGDGYSDVLVGAPYDFPVDHAGQAYLYLGSASGLAASAAWTATGSQLNAKFGQSLSSAGDVNGDGYGDVVVGQPEYSTTQDPDKGRALLYLGSASGLSPVSAWAVEGAQIDAQLGCSVAMAGDVNGDGFADTVLGARGHLTGPGLTGGAFLYYGNGGDGLNRIPRQVRADGTAPIALLGRSESETSVRLRERGLTPSGRGHVRLQYEFKPLGTPFDGTGLVSSAAQNTGTPGGSGSSVSFDEAVTGLGEGTFYRWRSRIVGSDPFFPRSPWISLAGNNVTETKLRTAGCVDRDGDGYGQVPDPSCQSLVLDCNDASPSAWGTPGETLNLRFTSGTNLVWDPPAAPGAAVSELVYDTLRSTAATGFGSPSTVCIESNDGPGTTANDAAIPGVGQVFFYLIRAEDACPSGQGSLGTTSSGSPRQGRSCP